MIIFIVFTWIGFIMFVVLLGALKFMRPIFSAESGRDSDSKLVCAHRASRQEMTIGSKQDTTSKAGTTPKNRLTPWLFFWTLTSVMRIFYRSQPFITDYATCFGLSWTNQRAAQTPAQRQPIHQNSHTWIVLKALESVATRCLPRNQRLKVEYGHTLGPHPSSNLLCMQSSRGILLL